MRSLPRARNLKQAPRSAPASAGPGPGLGRVATVPLQSREAGTHSRGHSSVPWRLCYWSHLSGWPVLTRLQGLLWSQEACTATTLDAVLTPDPCVARDGPWEGSSTIEGPTWVGVVPSYPRPHLQATLQALHLGSGAAQGTGEQAGSGFVSWDASPSFVSSLLSDATRFFRLV